MDKKQTESENVSEKFKFFGFKIEIMTNLLEEDFLDATFYLRTITYRPCRKPNNTRNYIHMLPNHPPEILKGIATSICEFLSRNFSKNTNL